MAMTFSSQGCRTAANDLTKSANQLNTILNSDLTNTISKVKAIYNSETAEQLYDAFEKMKDRFPDFIKSVTDCSKYLNDVVAPAYEDLEKTASSKIG